MHAYEVLISKCIYFRTFPERACGLRSHFSLTSVTAISPAKHGYVYLHEILSFIFFTYASSRSRSFIFCSCLHVPRVNFASGVVTRTVGHSTSNLDRALLLNQKLLKLTQKERFHRLARNIYGILEVRKLVVHLARESHQHLPSVGPKW